MSQIPEIIKEFSSLIGGASAIILGFFGLRKALSKMDFTKYKYVTETEEGKDDKAFKVLMDQLKQKDIENKFKDKKIEALEEKVDKLQQAQAETKTELAVVKLALAESLKREEAKDKELNQLRQDLEEMKLVVQSNKKMIERRKLTSV